MADFLPAPDPEFDDWFANFNAFLNDSATDVGVSGTDVTAINNAFEAWSAAWSALGPAQDAFNAAVATKNTARTDATPVIRRVVGVMQKFAGTTDALRAEARITIADTTRTRAPVPTTRPVLTIDNSQRLQQTVNFRDETTPNSKKKPDGVMGCELRCYVGDTPPANPEDYLFCALDTATPYLMVHDPAEAGKKAYVVGRWVNTRGEKGPWSESVMATIGA